ncbi:MAG TPA: preprotein translocase subunit SecE [Phycisphaerae bacterium]|nr:preprotein translocase subunit SecE [Phycisphaerae bacterium]
MSDLAPGAGKRSDESRLGGGGLRVYKAGQGYYTRVGTAIGAGLLSVWGAVFVFGQIEQYIPRADRYFMPVAYGVSVGFLAVMSILVYWVVGLNRKANDFFIATEGEMKKVSWATLVEVKRSTAVVIISVILFGAFLFAVDIGFMLLFRTIGVLKGAPLPWELFRN